MSIPEGGGEVEDRRGGVAGGGVSSTSMWLESEWEAGGGPWKGK